MLHERVIHIEGEDGYSPYVYVLGIELKGYCYTVIVIGCCIEVTYGYVLSFCFRAVDVENSEKFIPMKV